MAPRSPMSAAEYVALRSPAAKPTTPTTPTKNAAVAVDDTLHSTSAKHLTTDGSLVPISQLLRYADRTDYVLLAVGTLSALAMGLSMPIEGIFFGEFVSSFNAQTAATDRSKFLDGVNTVAFKYTMLGVVVLVVAALQVSCWSITASRQAKRIRAAYVGAILKQEIAWFDQNEPGQLSTRVADLTVTIQDGMGRKFADVIQFSAMMGGGMIVGLIKGWELALVLLAFTPVIAFSTYISMKVLSTSAQEAIESYSEAGSVAQESLGNIRTVHMFNSIRHFVTKYEAALTASVKSGIKKGFSLGWGTGLVFFVVFCTYACGMFYGALKVVNDRRDGCTTNCYDGGRVLTVFFSMTMGAIALGQAGPSVEAIFSARAAAFDVFAVIDRVPQIDPMSETGRVLPQVAGKIEIDNVTFAYPSRPDTLVCSDYSLTIEPGETVALVGPSGSGKSTVVALLERFYDPLRGLVKIDGVDVRDLNVKWLRRQIGLVGQEPALFATSIMENIRHGSPGATDDQVRDAAKMANAFNFIMEFPQGFATEVGERGAQLSGGQKQRIAIARAIIKNPSILLLDEATSALDTESERVVQASLDQLLQASKRTTIVVAHRLSTIRNADKIAVHSGGAIVEIGSHDQLMQRENGRYRLLVEAQLHKKDDAIDETIEEVFHTDKAASAGRVKSAVSESSIGLQHRKSATRLSLTSHKLLSKPDDTDSSVSGRGSEVDPVVLKGGMRRIWKMSLEDWKFLLLGSCGAVVNAAMFPVWGILLTKVTVLFFKTNLSRADVLQEARYWSAGFVAIGVVFGLSVAVQQYGFAVAAQRLVARVRLRTYTAMLQQEVGWFDLDENASGALVARLATDTGTLQAVTADTLNRGLVNVTTIVLSVAISMAYSWQVTLVVLACSPIITAASIMQEAMVSGTMNTKENNDADNAAGALLSEAIGSIRTVASFGMETPVEDAYFGFLVVSDASDRKVGVVSGVAFGVAQGTMWLTMAFQLWLGGKWVVNRTITFEDLFMVQNVIMLCLFAVGMAMQNLTDNAKAKKSVHQILTVLDRTPAIDSTSTAGDTLATVHGDLVFRDVAFTYPSRPDAQVYKQYSLTVGAGQTVALVGASGSGKSTAIALLERFYDPSNGKITLDGHDLRSLQLPWLRERISLVSQEPVLFAGSIADNIAMGKPGATRDDVIAAAKSANAFDFISQFPEGLDTRVGDRGAQVSGGQKQRIAIARAILRDPEVLLLDEATSALDNESERIVQASLDKLLVQKKRTTIIVAHRLSTIRHADVIAVTRDGEIVEVGTHDELVAVPNGVYKALVGHQAGIM